MTNRTVAGIEVYLQAADSKKVYLDLESIGAGAHATARVTLGSGRYRFVCLPADADPVRGPTVMVGAAPPGAQLTPGIVPVTRNDLIPVAKTYGTWVASRIPVLRQQVAPLGDDVAEGDLAAARHDWLTAHLTYETLGAAYDAFGDLGDAIDGMPAPGRTALTDPDSPASTRSRRCSGPAGAVPTAHPAAAVDRAARLRSPHSSPRRSPTRRSTRTTSDSARTRSSRTRSSSSSRMRRTRAPGTAIASIDANLHGGSRRAGPAARHPGVALRRARGDDGRARVGAARWSRRYRHADGTWTPLASLTARRPRAARRSTRARRPNCSPRWRPSATSGGKHDRRSIDGGSWARRSGAGVAAPSRRPRGAATAAIAAPQRSPTAPRRSIRAAHRAYPFHGAHQQGILTPAAARRPPSSPSTPPPRNRAELADLLRTITARARFAHHRRHPARPRPHRAAARLGHPRPHGAFPTASR